MRKLYIIGNGFDLQHGMKSRYWDFREYLQFHDIKLVDELEKYFDANYLWSNFEQTLADLDVERIIDECQDFLVPYSVEEWRDSYHHEYQYEIEEKLKPITETLKTKFTEWILQLKLPDTANENMVQIDRESLFINFNYTNTLEKLYRVDEKNILYIHNKAIDNNSILILGHGRNPKNTKTLNELYNNEDTDTRVAEGNRLLDDYFIQTYKSTETIIQEKINFFSDLANVQVIYVFGHSLSNVDKPYFEKIIEKIEIDKVIWKVSFHSKEELDSHSIFFSNLNIPEANVTFDRMNNIDSPQLHLFHIKFGRGILLKCWDVIKKCKMF